MPGEDGSRSPQPALVPAVRGRAAARVGLTDEPPPAGALRDRWDSLIAPA